MRMPPPCILLTTLEPFAASFNDLNVYANGVTDFKLGKIGTKLLFFEFSDDV